MDICQVKKIHMIGIKGVGMTMLAQYLAGQGIEITGSDTAEKFMTDAVLKKSGIKIFENFSPANIPADAELIVHSTAYTADNNEELKAARHGQARLLGYPEALSQVFNRKYGIAVIGSHGKTTTTAWLGHCLNQAGLSPTVMAGATVPQFGGSALCGRSDYLIAELDEYQNKLRYFRPRAVLLNNIDYDHPDFFPDAASYGAVFVAFIKKIPKNGFLIANFDDAVIRKTAFVNCRSRVITYAIDEAADFIAFDIKTVAGLQYFKVKMAEEGEEQDLKSSLLGDFCVKLAGRHNIYNALAVIAAAVELNVPLSSIRRGLAEFTGTSRRLQVLGEYRGALIIDDYAHHPTEVKATLAGVRELYPRRKITVVFHPHTYTRTLALLEDFAGSFDHADKIIILDIYGSAREKHGGVHSRDLVLKIKSRISKRKKEVKYIPALKECEDYLRSNIEKNEIILLMGAGDVFRIGENLLK
jgi:UDP-N-acetylmuramate--alanine ligase